MALNLRNLIFLLLIALGGAAVLLALFSEGIVPETPWHSDKIGHFLSFSAAAAILWRFKPNLKHLSLTLLIIFAVASEFAQNHYFPQRQFSVLDIGANLTGIGSTLIYLWFKSKRKPINT